MARITYRSPDGTSRELEVPSGESVMRGAVVNGVEGILAECGGGAMCATCHVYVAPGSPQPLPPLSDIEDELLHTTAAPRRTTSRLSCQLPVSDAVHGLTVEIPDRQL